MGYAVKDGLVRADFFKPSGKWHVTEALDMENFYDVNVYDAVAKAVARKNLHPGMMVVVVEPYNHCGFPVMLEVDRCSPNGYLAGAKVTDFICPCGHRTDVTLLKAFVCRCGRHFIWDEIKEGWVIDYKVQAP